MRYLVRTKQTGDDRGSGIAVRRMARGVIGERRCDDEIFLIRQPRGAVDPLAAVVLDQLSTVPLPDVLVVEGG
eukprot:30638-Eustigmatos_ZCMA.PRE.1